MGDEQLVIFRLENEEYGVPISQVREIIQYRNATKIPNTAEFIEGIISLRGKVIPVIDLAKRFALNIDNGSDRSAIIVEVTGQEVGVIVTEVMEVIRLQDTAIEPAPTIMAINDYIRGVGKNGDQLLILLDVDKLFGSKEIEELKIVS